MNSYTYTEGYSRGRADSLLDLVFRKAPEFMRVGGLVSNQAEFTYHGPEVSARVQARFREMLEASGGQYSCEMLKQISAEQSLHYQTVVRFTAPLRQRVLRGPRTK